MLKEMRRAFRISEGYIDGREFTGITHADQK
jgi:hypothetical protein